MNVETDNIYSTFNIMVEVAIAGRGYRGQPEVNDTQIMIPKPARKNASQLFIERQRQRFGRRTGIETVVVI